MVVHPEVLRNTIALDTPSSEPLMSEDTAMPTDMMRIHVTVARSSSALCSAPLKPESCAMQSLPKSRTRGFIP